MCLENVDRLDWVLLLTAGVDRLDSQHGVDGKGGEEVVVAEVRDMASLIPGKHSHCQDLGRHGGLGDIDQ